MKITEDIIDFMVGHRTLLTRTQYSKQIWNGTLLDNALHTGWPWEEMLCLLPRTTPTSSTFLRSHSQIVVKLLPFPMEWARNSTFLIKIQISCLLFYIYRMAKCYTRNALQRGRGSRPQVSQSSCKATNVWLTTTRFKKKKKNQLKVWKFSKSQFYITSCTTHIPQRSVWTRTNLSLAC